jgi:sulfur-oxidizing protein SoxY
MERLEPTRREFIVFGGMAALGLGLLPRVAFAEPADVELAMKGLFGGKSFSQGRIKLDVPQIAENGLVVPLNIEVESPMTENDYVKAVHVFADGNPLPNVISYYFTPASGRASASNRIRLAKTQNIIAVAEMSDGTLYSTKAEVKVTIGGCGG